MRKFYLPLLVALAACATPKTDDKQPETETESISDETSDPVMTLEDLLAFESEAALIETFGENNVTREKRYCPEGMCEYIATIVLKDQPNEIEYKWIDTENFRNAEQVSVYGEGTWGTDYGLALGTSLKELERMNGKSFRFAGFGWDYGGIVQWDGGKLDTVPAIVVLNFAPFDDDNRPAEADSLIGERTILSSDRVAQEINPVVYSIRYFRKM